MNIVPTRLPGTLILEPRIFRDDRGYFLETWNRDRFVAAGLPSRFVQDNTSFSLRGVLRGIHFQNPTPQGKLVHVLDGEIFDVAADIRPDSPTFCKWEGVTLSVENGRQFYIPEGFAHGFLVMSVSALVTYKCTDFYAPAHELSIRWDDPDLGITWPVSAPTLSHKDATAPLLREIAPDRLPRLGTA